MRSIGPVEGGADTVLDARMDVYLQTKSSGVFLHQSFFGGRGWTSRAAHLKKPRRGFFTRRTVRRVDAVRIHPCVPFFKADKTETPVPGSDTGVLGGRGWIRTTEAEKQQIYSLSPVATREHAQIQFYVVSRKPDDLFILAWTSGFVNLFFCFSFRFFSFSLIPSHGRFLFFMQQCKNRPAVCRAVYLPHWFICFRIAVICASEYPFLSSSVRIALSLRP